MKKILTFLFLTYFSTAVFSQVEPLKKCGHVTYQDALMQDPTYAQAHYERQARFNEMEIQVSIEGRAQCTNPTVLPIAIHYGGIADFDEACLIELAEQQIQILNDDYAGTNADITNWTNGDSSDFPDINNGETCLAFCLATMNHPSGFDLVEGQPAVTFNQFTGDYATEFSGYINIFVRAIDGGLIGYASSGGQGNGDGITIDPNFFSSGSGCGNIVPSAPYNLGRNVTSLLGHYLNLKHIWGDGDCSVDDEVADTPLQESEHYSCPSTILSSCGSPDLHMNFMDFTNDACKYMFTEGQSIRMENYVAANLQNLVDNAAVVCLITSVIEDIKGLNSMNVYPNPISETFFLTLDSDEMLELQVEMFDAVGRKVIDTKAIETLGTSTHSIDASQLSSGTYFVRITNGINTATTKVVKL